MAGFHWIPAHRFVDSAFGTVGLRAFGIPGRGGTWRNRDPEPFSART
jgi:hypothetical protein